MSDVKHTALPWVYHSGSVYKDGPDVFPKGNNNGIPIARADRDTELTQPTERDANMRLIVQAVNAFYPMLNVLRIVDKRLDIEAEEAKERATGELGDTGESFILAGYRKDIKDILAEFDTDLKTKKYHLAILWGSEAGRDEHDTPVHYDFDSLAEYMGFIQGIEEANGWLEYEIIEDSESEDCPCGDFDCRSNGCQHD